MIYQDIFYGMSQLVRLEGKRTLCSDGVDTILSTKREKFYESILKTRSVIYNLGIRSVSHQDSSHPPDEGAVGPLQTNSHRQYNVQ